MRDDVLLGFAREQEGVVASWQLQAGGFGASSIRSRLVRGRLHPVHHGVYAIGRPALDRAGLWWAAVLACGPAALLSHLSAAAFYGALETSQERIDVTVTKPTGHARDGVRVHHAKLCPADAILDDGLPRTSVPRTLLDLAAVVGLEPLKRAVDRSEIAGILDHGELSELLARSRGHRGIRKLRAVLAEGRAGEDVPRSELERRFLSLCRRAGLPAPRVNQWLAVPGEEMQVDFAWPERRVVVEADGYATHHTRHAFRADRRRDQLLTAAGWRALRVTWDDVIYEPARTASVLRTVLAEPSRPT